MRKHFLFLVCIFMALLPQTTLCQNRDLQSFLSGQKEKYFTKGHPKAKGINISIEYPSHWQRSEGERPNIVQKFSGDASDGMTRMCTILIIDLPELLKFFSSEDFLDTIFLPDTLKEMLPSGARFLKGDKTKYDGEPGAWMIYVMQEERSGLKFVMYVLQHVFFYSGKLVMIQCSVGSLASTSRTIERTFYEYLPLFYQMGNSIIIHDKWEEGGTNYGNDASSVINMDSSNSGMVYHRDEANGFAIWYPKTWAKVPTTHAATKLKVVSKSGAGGDDFNVVVISDPAFKNITGERMVEMWLERPEAGLAQLRKAYPDAKLIKSGKTYLDNKPAYYVIFDGTFRSFDLEFPMRFLQVSAVYNGLAYYLTSRTGPDEFDAVKPIFTLIMGGFKFLQQGATDYKSDTSSVVSKGGLWLGPTEILLTLIVLFILIGVPIIIRVRKKNNMKANQGKFS